MQPDNQTPPFDPNAEEATIASAILNPEVAAEIVAIVRPSDFYLGSHRAIFGAVADLTECGAACDVTTVASRLRDTGKLTSIDGGSAGLLDLLNRVPVVTNPAAYARKVKELAQLRALLATSQRITAACYARQQEPAAILAQAEQAIGEIVESASDDRAATAKEAATAVARRLEGKRRVLSTGFRDLDDILNGGLQPKQLGIIAARPAVGKSALVDEIGCRVAERGVGVVIVSLEMPSEDVMARLACARSRVPMRAYLRGEMTPAQTSAFFASLSELADLPLRIFDRTATLHTIYSLARSQPASVGRAKLGLLIVDHLGLIKPATDARATTREAEVANFSRSLKRMANVLDVPMLVLSQVSRKVAEDSRPPRLHDLRESGSIEADADLVLGLHRESYFNQDVSDELLERADLHVLKNRGGELGTVRLRFEPRFVAFSDAPQTYGDDGR